MTSTVSAISKPRVLAVDVHSADIHLGKDLLELLTSAMYVDPLNVYREYVQNAADALDAARRLHTFNDEPLGAIDIFIDPLLRNVRIRDNGTGIERSQFVPTLLALGASQKRGTTARGFRGVGRLAGLGYAQELIFRSRTLGEDGISVLRWDCRQLKAAFADESFDGSVSEIISRAVSVTHEAGGDYPAHFFEVELHKIVRQKNDKLLDVSAVTDYLRQIAPVPFAAEFKFASQIVSHLRACPSFSEVAIRINGGELLTRPHADLIITGEKKNEFSELNLIEIPAMDGTVSALGWILHHEYEGALPVSTLIKGLRVRAGNLQVGDQSIVDDIFQDVRFNSWSVGELHIIDSKIVPNGRRDNFEQNVHFANFINYLAPYGRDIANRCRTSSAKRAKLREFQSLASDCRERIDMVLQKGISEDASANAILSVEAILRKIERVIESSLFTPDEHASLAAKTEQLKALLAESYSVQIGADPLARLPSESRQMYEHLFELIYECSLNRVVAKSLIDKMIERIMLRFVST